MSIINRIFKTRDKPKNQLSGSTFSFFFDSTSSGKAVNERTVLQTTAVYACVRILAEIIASLPLHTRRYTDRGKKKALEHPLYDLLLNEPNSEILTPEDFTVIVVLDSTMLNHNFPLTEE